MLQSAVQLHTKNNHKLYHQLYEAVTDKPHADILYQIHKKKHVS